MSTVRFATLCDQCKRRSPEYTSWPTCRECGQEFCPNCFTANSLKDNEGYITVACIECHEGPYITAKRAELKECRCWQELDGVDSSNCPTHNPKLAAAINMLLNEAIQASTNAEAAQ